MVLVVALHHLHHLSCHVVWKTRLRQKSNLFRCLNTFMSFFLGKLELVECGGKVGVVVVVVTMSAGMYMCI